MPCGSSEVIGLSPLNWTLSKVQCPSAVIGIVLLMEEIRRGRGSEVMHIKERNVVPESGGTSEVNPPSGVKGGGRSAAVAWTSG